MPFKLTEDLRSIALNLALRGRPLKEIREAIGCSERQFLDLKTNDTTFAVEFSRARQEGLEEQADSLLTIHEIEPDVQKARLISDNTKWLLAKRKPETYGDRIDLNVNQTVDIGGALAEAKRRALPLPHTENIRDVESLNESGFTENKQTDQSSVVDESNAQLNSIDNLFD
jgi:hypothetical protein